MGAGAYVGRIGALAVALGIGAAVFAGQGVASAAPSSDSTGGSSSSSADSAGSTGSTAEEAGSASASGEAGTAKATKPTKPSRHRPASSAAASSSGSSAGASTSPEESGDSRQSPPAGAAVKEDAASTRVTERSSIATTETTPAVETDAATKISASTISASKVNATQIATLPVLSKDSSTGDVPPAPAEPAVALTLVAAARRETFGCAPTLAKTDTPVTNALTVGDVSTPTTPTPVVAIPQIAPLQGLQRLPVIGPLLITPIVTAIHQIPLIGDVLHPFIGYPVQIGVPAGTPLPRDVKVVSFDGTKIYVHFFPAANLPLGQKAPTILDGPGLALPGSTAYLSSKDEFLPNDVIGIGALRTAGYNVVTWDPRGEWNSGGQLEIDSPDFEARDVSAIISWIATQPDAALDPGVLDPRIGMVGASYGGGIQLVSAAIDHRIDAIVPTIAWNSLTTSLYKNEAFKSSWGTLLTVALVGTLARPNPRLYPAAIYGDLTGMVMPADVALLADRGPGALIGQITAPTLLIQGTVDTLFTLAEADANAKALITKGVDTKVIWYCGGHGSCVTSVNDGVLVQQRTLDWLAHYVVGTTSVDTGPQFEWVDQHGTQLSSNTYPVVTGTPVVTSTTTGGVLPLIPLLGGSGPQLGVLGTGPINALLGLPSGAKAANAFNLTTAPVTTTTYVVGAPQLTLTYSGVGTGRHVYAQLVDDTTGLVLGNLVTPISVTLDGKSHVAVVDLEQVAQTLQPGETVTLQLVASAVPYQTVNSFGALTVASVRLSLPTADPKAVVVGRTSM